METVDTPRSHVDGDGSVGERADQKHDAHHHEGHEAHHHHHHHHEEPISPDEAVSSLLVLGQVALEAGDYESATEAYASVLKIEQNETALYNLASFRARGLGGRRDYMEAARLFHQAELLGNKKAGKLCGKCMFDFINDGFGTKTPTDLYAAMAVFVSCVYPEAEDQRQEVNRGLFAVASTHYVREEFAEAAKVFRAAAEYGSDGYSQYYLAVLYDAGAGVPKNGLAALYWLDCAVDNGAADVALADRDGLLDAYRQGLSAPEFRKMMTVLSDWCEIGTPNVPANPAKAAYWREQALS